MEYSTITQESKVLSMSKCYYRHKHRRNQRKAHRIERAQHYKCADHDDITVRKVQHLRNTIYHRIAECYDCIDTSEADTIY